MEAGEKRRAIRALILGAVLGTAIALLAGVRDHVGARPGSRD